MCMSTQCEDDVSWTCTNRYAGEVGCSYFANHRDFCTESWAVDASGVPASEACPITCNSGCTLTYDSCWNNPCEGREVCTNLPGVNSYGCTCPAGFCTKNCATEDTLDHSDGNLQCPVGLCVCATDISVLPLQ